MSRKVTIALDAMGGDHGPSVVVPAALAKLTLSEPNFLVLDEPTNQLDIPSQEIMEQVLREFIGTILFVSHDRYLINALATQIWVIEGDELRVFKGDYQEYLARRQKEQEAARRLAEAQQLAKTREAQAQRETARPIKALDARTLMDVEEDIAHREEALQELAESLAHAHSEGDLDRARSLGVEYEKVETDLERLLAEWTALGEADG